VVCGVGGARRVSDKAGVDSGAGTWPDGAVCWPSGVAVLAVFKG